MDTMYQPLSKKDTLDDDEWCGPADSKRVSPLTFDMDTVMSDPYLVELLWHECIYICL